MIRLLPALVATGLVTGSALLIAVRESLGLAPWQAGGLTLTPYRALLASPEAAHAVGLTVAVSVGATIFSLFVGFAVALAIRSTRSGRRIATTLLHIPIALPHIVAATALAMVLSQSGAVARLAAAVGIIDMPSDFASLVYDRHGIGIAIVYVWKQAPFVAVAVLGVLRSLGTELDDQARTLGASRWFRLCHVTLPLVGPLLGRLAIVLFAFSFGAFEVPLLVGRPFPSMVSVVAYRLYVDTTIGVRPQALALSVVMTVAIGALVAGGRLVAMLWSSLAARLHDRRSRSLPSQSPAPSGGRSALRGAAVPGASAAGASTGVGVRLSRALPVARRTLLVVGAAATLAPLAVLALWSFSGLWRFPALVPETFTARAWLTVVSGRTRVLEGVASTVWISLLAAGLCLVIGVPAGKALASSGGGWRHVAWAIIVAPILVPPLAIAMGVHVTFLRVGLAGTPVGVALAHMVPALPYMVLMSQSLFRNLDTRFADQARGLGASRLRVALTVTAPLLAPGLATATLFVVLISWGQYALTLLVGGGRVVTLPVLLMGYAASGDSAMAGALGVLYVLPAIGGAALAARLASPFGEIARGPRGESRGARATHRTSEAPGW